MLQWIESSIISSTNQLFRSLEVLFEAFFNFQDTGDSAFHYCARKKDCEMARILLDAGSAINLKNVRTLICCFNLLSIFFCFDLIFRSSAAMSLGNRPSRNLCKCSTLTFCFVHPSLESDKGLLTIFPGKDYFRALKITRYIFCGVFSRA